MRKLQGIVLFSGVIVGTSLLFAQPPGGRDGQSTPPRVQTGGAFEFNRDQPPGRPDGGSRPDAPAFIERMMKFDANQDGKLSKDEVTDPRLVALFERADVDKDGVVTKEELMAIFSSEVASPGRGGPDGGGPDGPGHRRFGPGGNGPGGPGMGPPPIGQVLPPPIQGMLKLSKVQKKKLDALQRKVDATLDEVLTDDQKHQLDELRNHRPGGPGGDREGFGLPANRRPPGGPGGRGGDRNGPPDEGGRPQRPPE